MIILTIRAERFFRQVLRDAHTFTPRVITVDKNAAYPPAFDALQQEGILPETVGSDNASI